MADSLLFGAPTRGNPLEFLDGTYTPEKLEGKRYTVR